MVKKAVILNDDFDSFIKHGKIQTQKLSGGSEELVIDAAMKKRQEGKTENFSVLSAVCGRKRWAGQSAKSSGFCSKKVLTSSTSTTMPCSNRTTRLEVSLGGKNFLSV